jgi:hypothetical protein
MHGVEIEKRLPIMRGLQQRFLKPHRTEQTGKLLHGVEIEKRLPIMRGLQQRVPEETPYLTNWEIATVNSKLK